MNKENTMSGGDMNAGEASTPRKRATPSSTKKRCVTNGLRCAALKIAPENAAVWVTSGVLCCVWCIVLCCSPSSKKQRAESKRQGTISSYFGSPAGGQQIGRASVGESVCQ